MSDEPAAKPPKKEVNPEIEETRTSIDALLELLREKGKMELSSVAVTLNVDTRIVENWAKVLENGNLIRITYEVGRMYLEPVNLTPGQQKDLKNKTDLNKFILEEDLAIERISLDKFSKNIEQLNESVENLNKMYQSKLPDVQRILAEVDNVYAPLEAKKRSMDRIKDDIEKDFEEIDKKADSLYAKLNSFSPKQAESKANDRGSQLSKVLESTNDAKEAINDLESNKDKFFSSMEAEIESQVKDIKRQFASSKYNIEYALKTNSKQLNELIKGIKSQVKSAQRISKEVDSYRKEFETAKHDLEVLRGEFKDKYERIKQGMGKDRKIIDSESKRAEEILKSIKDNFGDVGKFDDELKKWARNVSDMSRDVIATKTEIIKLTNQLNALDSSRNMSVEKKAKALEGLKKEGKATKDKTAAIKKSIKDVSDEIKRKAEGAK